MVILLSKLMITGRILFKNLILGMKYFKENLKILEVWHHTFDIDFTNIIPGPKNVFVIIHLQIHIAKNVWNKH